MPQPFHDISRQLTEGHPSWPGDVSFQVRPAARISQGDSVNTGVLTASTHTGTHVDAPWHYSDAGERLDEVPLERFVGPCLLLDARGHDGGSVPASLLDGLDALPGRLLLYTGQPSHWDTFPISFAALSPELIRRAAELGARLIGTDAPSVDPLTSKTLVAHRACLEAGVLIVEGLRLGEVPPGEYELVCLPLPLAGADGAPARAILFSPEGQE